jgi:hypothetical protein
MSKRWLPLMLAGVLFTFGLAAADDPPGGGQEEPPVRLKKKGKVYSEEKPKAEPGKPAEKKEPAKKEEGAEAAPAKEPEPEIDEQEVLNRIAKTMRTVEKKLAKPDLDESLHQAQDDIVKDLDSLIRSQENPPQDQGGGGGEDNKDNKDQDKSKAQQGKQGQQEQQAKGQRQRNSGKQQAGKQGSRRQRRHQQQRAGGRQPMGGQSGGQPQGGDQQAGNQGQGGNKPGAGRDSPRGPNVNAELYKDIWGHLPEALRAEMNAYSNPEPFLAKYDDLIRKYYRTIAEQGRKKGD